MPGNNGGANWGGAAVYPAGGILVVVSKDVASTVAFVTDCGVASCAWRANVLVGCRHGKRRSRSAVAGSTASTRR